MRPCRTRVDTKAQENTDAESQVRRAFVCRVRACGPDGVRGRRRIGGGAGTADHHTTAAVRAATGEPAAAARRYRGSHFGDYAIHTWAAVTGGGTVYRNSEVEPQVAVNPRDPGNIVVTWQQDRWSTGGASGIVTAASTDGGTTWTQAAFPVSRCGGGNAGNGGDYGRATDPWVTFGPTGVVYQMALAFEGNSLQPGSRSAMLVARSTDGGRTWSAATPLITSDSSFFNDKNTITADPTDPNFVYATWDRLALAGGGPALMARTTDGGASWEAARVIFDPGPQSQTIGNQIVVLPNGTLVNFFTQLDPGPNSTQVATIRLIRSTDRGGSWSAPVTVAGVTALGARDPATQTLIRDGSFVPAVTVAPNGTLWVAWQDARFSGVVDGIALARSTDGGLTWSAPVQVNSEHAVAAFTPTVRVRADGTIARHVLRPAQQHDRSGHAAD